MCVLKKKLKGDERLVFSCMADGLMLALPSWLAIGKEGKTVACSCRSLGGGGGTCLFWVLFRFNSLVPNIDCVSSILIFLKILRFNTEMCVLDLFSPADCDRELLKYLITWC